MDSQPINTIISKRELRKCRANENSWFLMRNNLFCKTLTNLHCTIKQDKDIKSSLAHALLLIRISGQETDGTDQKRRRIWQNAMMRAENRFKFQGHITKRFHL